MRSLRVAIAQVDPTVGDLEANADLIADFCQQASDLGADLVAFPELCLTGYPPEDLVLRHDFQNAAQQQLEDLAEQISGPVCVLGTLRTQDGQRYNSAAIITGGAVRTWYDKRSLPNYGVFDEARNFSAGSGCEIITVAGVRLAISICEDIWSDDGPTTEAADAGAECIVNLNASPFHQGKMLERKIMLHQRSVDHNVAIVYAQMIGGQDELVFDGGSMVYDKSGHLIAKGSQFETELIVADLSFPDEASQVSPDASHIVVSEATTQLETKPAIETSPPNIAHSPEEETYQALMLGLRAYVDKNSFPGAIIGMSGGIDSALTATLAADALGSDRVLGVAMPSAISADRSLADAKETAANLGIDFDVIPIGDLVDAFDGALADAFAGLDHMLADENLQSRIRGTILMALSNATGKIVLTTGNKSEMAVGYSTLYGDTAGGFAVLKDVPKTLVYGLARYRNSYGLTAIPEAVITRPPTAELRHEQLDTDSLPPYKQLDPILEAYVEHHASRDELIEMGYEAEIVDQVTALVDRAEYKRRQTPPGIKITPLSFGRDRRLPITDRFNRRRT